MSLNHGVTCRSTTALLAVFSVLVVVTASPALDTWNTDRATANCTEPPTGLIAWWGADGNTGDVFGTYDGTLGGDATFDIGKVGQAFVFDGSGDFVELPDSSIWDFGTNSFSLAAWFNSATVSYFSEIIAYHDGSSAAGSFLLRLDSDGLPQIYICDQAGPPQHSTITGTTEYDDGLWHLMVGVRDAATRELSLYVDGNLVAGPSFIETKDVVGAFNNRMMIGAGGWGSGGTFEPFNGLIDEAMVFNRALSLAEVQAMYDAGSDGSCRPCTRLPDGATNWWRAEDTGSDEIGTGDGTLVGDTTYADGKVGRGFQFDGAGDRVDLNGTTLGDFGASAFTVALWMRPDTSPGSDAYIVGRSNPNGGLGWDIRQTNSTIRVVGVDGWGFNITSGAVLAVGSWHHVALVGGLDSGSGDDVVLYVDGSTAGTSGRSTVGFTTNPLRLGFATNYGGSAFQGLLDEIQIFDRALAEEEIQALANADSTGVCTDCTPPPGDMVSWWQGESSVEDAVGDNDGSLVNGASYDLGLVGQSFDLEGSDDYVEIPNDPSLSFGTTDPMSIDLWVYRTSAETTQHIIGKRSACSAEAFNYQIVLDPAGGGICFSGNNGTPVSVCSSGGDTDLPMNTWTHLAATFDGDTMRLYIDGQEAAAAASALGAPDTATLRIGTSGTCGLFAQDFDGFIDEVEIHSRALSRDEVYAIHNAGAFGKCPLPDTVPGPFVFTDQTSVPVSSVTTSNTVTVSGINTATTIDISACTGTACEYSVNGGGWTATPGSVVDGDTAQVRQTSSASYGTTTDLTLDIGGVSDTFSVTTLVQHTLTVSLSGTGTGTVTSTPASIDCPDTNCSALFDDNQTVTLTPVADPDSQFHGWTGDADCSDGEVVVTTDIGCTATFGGVLPFSDGFETGDTSKWDSTVP